jgi:hypothetical protein
MPGECEAAFAIFALNPDTYCLGRATPRGHFGLAA